MSHDGAADSMAAAGAPGGVSLLCARWATDEPDSRLAGLRADWLTAATQLVWSHGGQPVAGAPGALCARFGGAAVAADQDASVAADQAASVAADQAVSVAADQAARALHCGQALQAAARAHEALARRHGPRVSFAIRQAVHSPPRAGAVGLDGLGGAVGVLDGPADAGLLAAEQPAWQAATRMAAAVPPGRLCLCHDTVALVRGLFDVEPIVPLPLPLPPQPGLAPLQVGLLVERGQGPSADARRTSNGNGNGLIGPIDLIGRSAEWLLLQQAYARLIARPGAAALTVVADAGMGKRRLLAAFDGWAQAQPQPVHTLRARALPHNQAQPFALLRALFYGHCRIAERDPPAAALQRLEQAFLPWFVADHGAAVAEGHAHSLAYLIGIDLRDSPHIRGIVDDPRQIRLRALHAARQWLRRLSAGGRSPVLLRLDDLHWADEESLDFLASLLQANGHTALLLLASSRPELAHRRAMWLAPAAGHQALVLQALSPGDSRLLALAWLAKLPSPPPALVDRLTAGSGGHPRLIEERLQWLIDRGVVTPGVDAWQLDRVRLRRARMPATLGSVLKARLALLPAAQREALQRASLIGPSFSLAALQALGAPVAEALPLLLDRSWAVSLAGAADAFAFRSSSLQQVAYASLPRLTRRALHGTLARWLVAAGGLGSPALPAETAQHFEQAGEDLLAAEHHVRAAQHAAALFAPDAVLRQVQRGLDALQRLPTGQRQADLRWRLLRRRVSALEILGRDAQYEEDLAALAALADELADDARRTEVASMRCGQLLLSEDYGGLMLAARQSMALAERAGLHDFRISGMRMLADAHCGLGDWDAGARLARQALAQAQAMAQHAIAANCLNTLAAVAERQQDPLGRIRCHEQALDLTRQTGDRRGEATQLVNLSGAWLRLGDLVAARPPAEQGLALAKALGARLHESVALSHAATLALWLGHADQAQALAEQALDAALAAGAAQAWQVEAQLVLGAAALALGDDGRAQQAFEQARAMAHPAYLPRWLDAIAGLARVALRRADVAAAMALVQAVFDLERDTQSPHDANSPRSLDLVCHRVLASVGDPRAQAWLQRAHGQLMVTAASVADPALREGFLNNIPDHRAILAAWAAAQQAPRPGASEDRP